LGSHSIDIAELDFVPHPVYGEQVLAIEAELRRIWPGFKRIVREIPNPDPNGPGKVHFVSLKGQPFTEAGQPKPPFTLQHVRRIKWLLKRYELLQAGRDLNVKIIETKAKPGRCFVHVDLDKPQQQRSIPAPIDEHVGTTALAPKRTINIADLALTIGAPLDRVEAAVNAAPEDAHTESWVRDNWREVDA